MNDGLENMWKEVEVAGDFPARTGENHEHS